jgi:two-component system cell cycle sensor histidine kinase/response regulator CckA
MFNSLNGFTFLRRRAVSTPDGVTEEHEPTVQAPAAETASAAIPARSTAATVLVVDDDEVMRNLERRILTKAGFNVEEARNGVHAQNLVKKGLRPDLIIVDLRMPGLSGDAMARQIRQMCPDQRFLFVTGNIGELISLTGSTEQNEVVLGKPFCAAALVEAVVGLVGVPS